MFIGIDDTDSREGMCTTYLASRIYHRFRKTASDFPWLVRLNPNIAYKTRGNGAVVVEMLTPPSMDAKTMERLPDGEYYAAYGEIIDYTIDLVSNLSMVSEETNPGIVFSRRKIPETLYRAALYREISMDEVRSLLDRYGARFYAMGNGRGLIGASAAISWPGKRHTYEVMNYFYPHGRHRTLADKIKIAGEADLHECTFDSVDRANRRPAIFPRERTPVVYGIRGTDPVALKNIAEDLNRRHSIESEMITVFKTNQGTDDHIVADPEAVEELGSYALKCMVSESPHPATGGHYFFHAICNGRIIKFAAFEPTKEFRSVVRKLVPGDEIVGYGSYIDSTINLERLTMEASASVYTRRAPACKLCGKPMSNRGAHDFRCISCGTADNLPSFSGVERSIEEGDYEVPVAARRHLSMPLVLSRNGE